MTILRDPNNPVPGAPAPPADTSQFGPPRTPNPLDPTGMAQLHGGPAPINVGPPPVQQVGQGLTQNLPVGAPAPQNVGQTFGPDNNLIGQQISPTSPQFNYGAPQQQATDLAQNQLFNVGQGRGRQDIALDMLKNFDEEQADTRQLGIQDIGRNAARFGRLGSGVTSTSLGDFGERQEVQRNRFMRNLLGDTAGAEIGDRRADLNSLLGASSQFGAQDLARSGVERGFRGEQRGERDYQRGLAREDVDSRQRQLAMQDQLAGNAFQRRAQLAQMLSGQGFGGGEQNLAGLLGNAMQGQQGGEWDWLKTAGGLIPGLL